MKLNVLHHDPRDFAVPQAGRMTPITRSTAPHLHPFTKEKELVRATNAAKLGKMFAKPFSAALSGHQDGISCMTRARTAVAPVFTGSYDGELRMWNAAHRRCFGWARAHSESAVRGVTISLDDKIVYSCGGDRAVRAWAFDRDAEIGRAHV